MEQSIDRVFYYHGDHLNSSTYVTDDNGRPVAYYDYLPFGEVAVEHNQTTNFNNGYKFNAKELDQATGMYYYGARYYDPRLSVFISVDPLAEETMTPYQYCSNNSINRIDPTGMLDNPIYDTDGNFLGTDDKGLQGKAIVMNKKNFTQGMSHQEALSYNLGAEELNKDGIDKLLSHYNGLKDRPDYDGGITLDEANDWYRNGNGKPLFADLGQLDLGSITPNQFEKKDITYFNLLFRANRKEGLVYGTIGLTNLGNNEVKGYFDIYDFDIRPWDNIGNVIRNIETKMGDWKAGNGNGYRIYFYGKGKISPNREIFTSDNPGLLKPGEMKW